jgi:6-phosphogluconate dehydrogenase
MKEKADIGMIGIGVMGGNLVLNMERRGYRVVVYDVNKELVEDFVKGKGSGKRIVGVDSPEEMVKLLKKPAIVMIMVPAGLIVDRVIEGLIPFLDKGDVIIDGGNSHYDDTTRRVNNLKEKGIYFIGAGISGGEEGALTGPSIMPGGATGGWEVAKPILTDISAKIGGEVACCRWVGEEGAGHMVKMVHNGIEYGDMQLISEAYHLLKEIGGMKSGEIGEVFKEWNRGELNSYLIEITAEVLAAKDKDGEAIVDKIEDRAEQKGTGRWTVMAALEASVPLPLIAESLFARYISSLKEKRQKGARLLEGPEKMRGNEGNELLIEELRKALYAAKVTSYAQGYELMLKIGKEKGWEINPGEIALIWRGGCIIRSRFLEKIKEAFDNTAGEDNLLLSEFFSEKLKEMHSSLRSIMIKGIKSGIPLPAFGSALSYYDSLRSERLPANLIQAQRDYFGAHGFRREGGDGTVEHFNWKGERG